MEDWVKWGVGIAIMLLGILFANQQWEIRNLRAWRHKVGDDPSYAISKLYDLLDRRVVRLESKVFNGKKEE